MPLDQAVELTPSVPLQLEDCNAAIAPAQRTYKRGFTFWMVFVANLMVDLLSALDLTSVTTALPTIIDHFDGSDFIWAGSGYAISSTAILPVIGGVVSVFGRKPALLAFVSIFAIGSAICGAAQTLTMFIAGRVIQGLGGGGCISITEIIYADLVPLPERGKFVGIQASVWALACAMGPVIGGAFAGSGNWRWLFYLNLPLCGIAILLELVFLKVHTPKDSLLVKVKSMDWIGLTLIISSTLAVLIALTWAGVRYPWSSVHVLVPLCLGFVGIASFFVIERTRWIKEPTIPPFIVTNRTTLSGYLGTFFHGISSMAMIFYLPVYFQASKLASPIHSGVDMFGLGFTIPIFAIATGVSVEVFHRYRPQNYIGWMLITLGFGLLSILDVYSSTAMFIGLELIIGTGMGMVWIGTQFPILAPLPFSNNAHALAFFTFVRCFAQSWGIVIGGTVLQNVLRNRLPESFISTLPGGTQLVYSIIPRIPYLTESLKEEVRVTFAESATLIWRVMIGVSGAGLLTCLPMQEIVMRESMDEKWGLQDEETKSTTVKE
ncbi:uncharacterized protein FIBRA_02872 [Fibroporia radiculosa]|uniref:Major facilitator superfamily (MFS) profile domain-containing protein n=1 Tax=Fibroporia radiculosa TaxID=599839 RepID=J4GN61_9APHY|nr:uncharacterized protein FIBRA_02872 [Fibroporia radiculosa]CCM00830.1 predicted protein [Fibroporia radiculosa]